jgi:tRNA (guanine37-N1)-methyltransferase
MRFDVLTLFPEICQPYLQASILGRAVNEGLLDARLHQIRDYANDRHGTVDDTPYGGGAGMVMKVEPIYRALQEINQEVPRENQLVLVMAARGKQFTQEKAREIYNQGKSVTLICGRYEGIDQRVADELADEEISIGPYVLAGGELGALVVMEAVARLVPGVLGNPESLAEESYSLDKKEVEYPQYTKPEEFNGWRVPDILLSGNHEAIRQWRKEQ